MEQQDTAIGPELVGNLLKSDNLWIALPANAAVFTICMTIVCLGVWAFMKRSRGKNEVWGDKAIQTLGTIFFFPTLIVLAIYLELPREAVTTILGAFLGYLFGRGASSDRSNGPTVPDGNDKILSPSPVLGTGEESAVIQEPRERI